MINLEIIYTFQREAEQYADESIYQYISGYGRDNYTGFMRIAEVFDEDD